MYLYRKCFILIIQREAREAKEARQLEYEIVTQRRQQHEKAQHQANESNRKKDIEHQKNQQTSQVHTQIGQVQRCDSSDRSLSSSITPPNKSPRDSVERTISLDNKNVLENKGIEKKNLTRKESVVLSNAKTEIIAGSNKVRKKLNLSNYFLLFCF